MTIRRISYNNKEIILLGTAHVSKKSRELVEKTIEEEKPDIVGIELDKGRYKALKSGEKFEQLNIIELIKSGQAWVFLINIILKNFQRQIGKQLGEKPGSEMIAALNAAEEKKLRVALLDRDVKITLKRAFSFLTLGEKIRFITDTFVGLFSKDEKNRISEELVEKLKEKDTLNALMQKMGHEYPTIKKVLVDERDQYIAHNISKLPGKKILAVLGAGHLEGVESSIGKKVDIKEITDIPKKTSMLKIFGILIPLIVIGLIAYAFITKGTEIGVNTVVLWILVNGTLSALGVLIARGHILAAITAFIAAPITTLHPLLAVGWFAGLAQAKISLPQVKDFEQLSNLNTYTDFEKNKVTKVLLVVVFANLGATIGMVIALPWIASLVI
ncbi:MAG TPA: TraB/GumN family protein [Candidatus Bilamarchaeaceae archaeon]|nr:TraB/GumN family protein [Candidatus Bilamarchaeaceae archaeon]